MNEKQQTWMNEKLNNQTNVNIMNEKQQTNMNIWQHEQTNEKLNNQTNMNKTNKHEWIGEYAAIINDEDGMDMLVDLLSEKATNSETKFQIAEVIGNITLDGKKERKRNK